MEEKGKYKKKMKLYKALGAEEFQKVVFAFERFKFKVIEKLFPNLLKRIENKINKNMQKRLSSATTEEERKEIIEDARMAILKIRKEFNTRKNINYHMDKNNPTEIIDYLNLNKKIHTNNLKVNGVLALISIVGIIFHVPGAVALLIIEALSGIINFECVNIQNYNLCRLERVREHLERRAERKKQEEQNNGAAYGLIYDRVMTGEKMPSMKEIIESCETPEQLSKLKELLLKEYQSRGIGKKEGSFVK